MAIPSLAMIPSGYKDGKVYSVLPSNGDGDFTFSRGSNATRVNKNGLIETMPLELGEELVTNGDFATDSDWIKGSGWSISGGEANCSGSGTGQVLYQQNIMPLGTKYKITVTVSSFVSGYLSAFGGDWDTEIIQSNGTFTRYTKSLSVNTGFVGNNFIGSIDNVSVKEVISGYDTPRLDYSDSSCPSLLLEPQRTNLIQYSEDFSQSYWTKGGATISLTGISPNGSIASLLTEDTTTGEHRIYHNNISVTSGVSYTNTFYIKSNGRSRIRLSYYGFNNYEPKFDFVNNQLISSTGGNTPSISSENVGNDWYRVSITDTTNQTQLRGIISLMRDDNSFIYSGDGTSGVYIYGAMLEEGSYATSYIPTNGAIATRLADACTGAGNEQVINSSEGVLYLEMNANNLPTFKHISLSDGSSANRLNLFIYNSDITVNFEVSGVRQSSLSYTIPNVSDFNKVAFSYKLNQFKLFVNGLQKSIDTTGLVPSINTFNSLSFNNSTSSSFHGNVKDVRVYNTALTDAELEELTTL